MGLDLLPWATSAVGISIIWMAGRRRTRRLAWFLGLANQALWISYALATAQYGFIAGSAVYGAMYANNLRRGDR